MFKYVNDISELAHDIIRDYCSDFNIAVDGTLGNGNDTDFLKKIFKKVYAFEIQKEAVDKYAYINESKNVHLINDSHHKIKDHIKENIDCAIYNLGYLPGGDKNITTMYDTTIESIKGALELLNSGGIAAIVIYHGHEEGKKEKDEVLNFLQNLSSKEYGVMLHKFLNRSNIAPLLAIVEKK